MTNQRKKAELRARIFSQTVRSMVFAEVATPAEVAELASISLRQVYNFMDAFVYNSPKAFKYKSIR